jgi:hypothetical protein
MHRLAESPLLACGGCSPGDKTFLDGCGARTPSPAACLMEVPAQVGARHREPSLLPQTLSSQSRAQGGAAFRQRQGEEGCSISRGALGLGVGQRGLWRDIRGEDCFLHLDESETLLGANLAAECLG